MKYNAFISYSHAADSRVAPALQSSLHKLAKPWYRIRALNVFRDQTDLSTNPHLWESIEKVLEVSEYFLLLASPEAAASKWVGMEIEYWLEHKSAETLLLVVTDGEIAWDEGRGDFDWSTTNAIPRHLAGVFEMEPLYVDLREVRAGADLSLENPRFRDCLLPLAAALHHTTVGNMVGEEVRQHRKTLRIRNATILTLSVLFLAATVAAIVAYDQKILADKRFRRAKAGELAARAALVESRDPTLSFRLAEASLIYGTTTQARAAIFRNYFGVSKEPFYQVMQEMESIAAARFSLDFGYLAVAKGQAVELFDRYGQYIRSLKHSSKVMNLALSGDSRLIGTLAKDNTVSIWSRDGQAVDSIDPADSAFHASRLTFSPAGRYLLLDQGAFDPYLYDLQSRAGQLIDSDYTMNSQMVLGYLVRFSPDERYLAFCLHDASVFLYDLQARWGKRISGTGNPTAAAFSSDSQWLLIGTQDGVASYNLVSSKLRTARLSKKPDNPVRAVENVAEQVASGESGTVQVVFTIGYEDGSIRLVDQNLSELSIIRSGSSAIRQFNANHGARLLLASSEDNMVHVFDQAGVRRQSLRGHTGRILDVSYLPSEDAVFSVSGDGTVRKWFLDVRPYWSFDENQGGPLQIAPYFSATAGRVVAPGGENAQQIFDVTGKLIESQPKPEYREPPHDVTPEGIEQPLFEADAAELLALEGFAELVPIWEEFEDALGEAFSPGATHVRISPGNSYLLLCRMDFVTNSYFGNFVVVPIDIREILRLVDEQSLFGAVWELDDPSRARFGMNESTPTIMGRLRLLVENLLGREGTVGRNPTR